MNKDNRANKHPMIRSRYLLFAWFLISLLSWPGKTFSQVEESTQIRIIDFVEKPFGTSPSIENFKLHDKPKLKLQRYRFKKYQSDTIYRFYRGSNQLFFNKSQFDETFMSGVITSRRFVFHGGIHIGMKKEDFLSTFSEAIPDADKDTLSFKSSDYPNNYHFYFKRKRLKKIKIDNLKEDQGGVQGSER